MYGPPNNRRLSAITATLAHASARLPQPLPQIACQIMRREGRNIAAPADGMTMPQAAEIQTTSPASVRPVAPYSRPATLAKLDGRRREARLMREARAELVAHVGGNPSATQRALIEQCVQLRLRLAVMDRAFAEAGGAMTAHDSRTYLAWSNSYSRTLRQLGLKGAPAPVATLAGYLAAKAAQPAASAAPAPPVPRAQPSITPPPAPAQRGAAAADAGGCTVIPDAKSSGA